MATLDWPLCFNRFKRRTVHEQKLNAPSFQACVSFSFQAWLPNDLPKYEHCLQRSLKVSLPKWSGDGFNHNLALEFILKIFYHKILWLASFAFKPQHELHWSSLGNGSRPSFSGSLGHIVWSSNRVHQTTFSATKINCITQANSPEIVTFLVKQRGLCIFVLCNVKL